MLFLEFSLKNYRTDIEIKTAIMENILKNKLKQCCLLNWTTYQGNHHEEFYIKLRTAFLSGLKEIKSGFFEMYF